ncbi:hypothetical protein NDU88_010434 [Pleurodeles waltl]|uniref:Alpha-tectorin n=1 Tax=Pleurodeles waltl TaxID=8319 RepID=A0AAV7PW07_PLEWA|nr:hypothetical protein NDU88_010434 [Pleurodeles waltl]
MASLALVVLIYTCLQLCTAQNNPVMYPYGLSEGDLFMGKVDDGSTIPLPITVPFRFFDQTYLTLIVNTNGVVSFGVAVSQYTSDPFPLSDGRAFVAPFWADVDIRIAGNVFYRESRNATLLRRASNEVHRYFGLSSFNATWLYIATWDKVAYYGSTSSKVNTFQAVLIADGVMDFILLNYDVVVWTTGTASGGSRTTGLGGTQAQAGFNSGGSSHYFSIPGSRTADILNVASTSNVNTPGVWAFRVDTFQSAGGCVYNGAFLTAGTTFWNTTFCQHKCQCLNTSIITCQKQPCVSYETCKPVANYYSCQATGKKTCLASGDPHYTSFDGRYFNFQGTCTYLLSQPCRNNSNLTYFRVEAKNENRGNTKVSWVKLVRVVTYGNEIVMSKGLSGQVYLNGNKVRLPVTLLGGNLKAYQTGFTVAVSTDFGLVVTYDGFSHTTVTLLPNYANSTCGLCGNLNSNSSDDFMTPNGTQASTEALFGKSWKVPDNDALCSDDYTAPTCTSQNQTLYNGSTYCGLMRLTTGAFASCIPVLSPENFVSGCIYDLCATEGNQSTLCNALQSYTERCQALNVTVGQWRSSGFCGASCPANSMYQTCGTACPSTCSDSTSNLYCTLPCREGCFCNSSYILSGGSCVPINTCGCNMDGQYYNLGDEVILTGTCSQKCTCSEAAQDMVCEDYGCSSLQECKVVDGVRGCYRGPYGICTASGDPHYRSFDGLLFDYQGTCKTTLSKYCGAAGNLSDFSIQVVNEHRTSTRVAWTRSVEIRVYGELISIVVGQKNKVQVNGSLVNLPVKLQSGRVQVIKSGSTAKLQTDFGLSVTYDWSHSVVVKVPLAYSGLLCGLCGDFDGNKTDDFRAPNGTLLTSAGAFGNSWQEDDSLFHCLDTNSQPQCSLALQTQYRSLQSCGIMSDPIGPFRGCNRLEDPSTYMDNCVYDLCATDGDKQSLCDSLQSYTQECQNRGLPVLSWRNLTGCDISCPSNSRYELCGSSCPSSCAAPSSSSNCSTPCAEGCQCNSGFILSADDCVPQNQCGCTYNDQYFKAGQTYRQGSNCQTLCKCDGSTGTIQCSSSPCASTEVCTSIKGVYGCYALPDGICRASGDPHYTSFDGQRFDFQGTCKYVLSELRGTTGSLPFFRVEVKNENWQGLRVAVTTEVFVTAYNTLIHLQSGRRGKAEVNGTVVSLPASLNGGSIIIYQSGSYSILKTDFGLRVNYDMVYSVFVTLPSRYWGQVGGLCGNFNGLTSDDFTMRNGSIVKNAFNFGKSWISNGSTGCDHGCSDSCPVCNQDMLSQSKSACWIIQNPKGPFSSCHSKVDPAHYFSDCVYDHCLTGANSTVLCQAIEAYVATCQAANATISSWRSTNFCAMLCPENSQYTLCGQRCQDLCASSIVMPKCDATCVEGCICNSGFKRSGDLCIPDSQCGCSYDGLYYNVGELVWLPGCSQRCRCSSSGRFNCVNSSCGKGQECAVKDGKLGCQMPWAICTVTGDPHYHSFDKAVANFMGTCAYEISQGSDSSSGFSFRVVAENRRYQNPRVSFVYRVTIWFNSTERNVKLVFEQGKASLVNGVKTTLPVTLGSIGNVTAKMSTISVVTPFGIRIQYNGVNTLMVQVGPQYQNRLRGMCGNYNGDGRDDKLKPDGTMARNDTEFGNSWRADISSPGCVDDAGLINSNKTCTNLGAIQGQCGIITRPLGPFDECLWYEDADPFYESCVYDLCYYGANKGMVCTAVQSFEAICNLHSLVIPDWRSELQCDDSCPENSHYELFGTGCPTTCSNLHQSAPCTAASIDGCFCDEGFALDSGLCVPENQCGCTMDGVYYNLGDVVFLTDTCNQKCTCIAQQMVCEVHTCAALEECKVMNGIRKCYPVDSGICWASGDPHYRTFDGVAFDYQGTCKYTLSKYTAQNGTLIDFSVMVQNEHRSSPVVAWTRTVEVNVYGEQISLESGKYGTVQVNGSQYILPVSHQSGKIQVYYSGSSAVLQTDFGLVVSFDWKHHVSVQVPAAYSGSLAGLCGNFNGNKSDDFRIPDGSLVGRAIVFGNSWKQDDDEDSSFICVDTDNPPVCAADMVSQFSNQNHCGIMKDPTGPFNNSINADTEVYFKNCVYDLCGTDGDQQTLCEIIKSYAHHCQNRGNAIRSWRSLIGCDITCSSNQKYELCGPSCPATCAGASNPCRSQCKEGCQCESGFVLSGTDCVPQSQCGCTENGKYYRAGDTFWKKDNCQTLCRCDGTTRTVQCSRSSCATGETCTTVKGIYGCHVLPDGICRASGDPHYTSFDGRRFDFQGTCKYVLSEVQGSNGSLPFFRVEVKNEQWQGLRVAVTKEVFVSVYQTQIYLQSGRRGTVEINGIIQTLPVNINSGRIIIFKSGAYTVLRTDFGLTVNYDMVYSVFVTLPDRFQGQTSGLCGNFNGLVSDDFTTRIGSVVTNAFTFGSSWVSEGSTSCDHGCSGDCPVCSADKIMASKRACWIIQDPRGPFSSCHSMINPAHYYSDCVYDHCLTEGNSTVLCHAIQTYTATCQAANVTIATWRNSSFCVMECPVNSHYEVCHRRCQDSCIAPSLLPHCDATCSEGCFCDDGYQRSGDTCLKAEQCGCELEGMYYNVGEYIWLSDCSKRCRCDSTGNFRCTRSSCAQGQECVVKNGKLGCQSPWAICTVTGDPHYHTFDGTVANFMGTCAYEISQGFDSSSGFSYRVVGENRRYLNPRVSFVYRVTILLNSTDGNIKLVFEQGKVPLTDHVSMIHCSKSPSSIHMFYLIVHGSPGIQLKINTEKYAQQFWAK